MPWRHQRSSICFVVYVEASSPICPPPGGLRQEKEATLARILAQSDAPVSDWEEMETEIAEARMEAYHQCQTESSKITPKYSPETGGTWP